MDWFVLALSTRLSESQRIYFQQILQDVAAEFAADLADPKFCDWIDEEVLRA